ncbi:hypothetical protein U1Q18_022410 [Sarracenia purpurea var. burkii]
MATPSKEVCKSFAGVEGTVGCPIGLEGSQVQGRQEVANSSGSGELPMHIAEYSSVGIVDDSLDKSNLISCMHMKIQIHMGSPKLTYTNMKASSRLLKAVRKRSGRCSLSLSWVSCDAFVWPAEVVLLLKQAIGSSCNCQSIGANVKLEEIPHWTLLALAIGSSARILLSRPQSRWFG